MKRLIIGFGLFLFLGSFQIVEARSYDYEKIEVRATINTDTTIDIEETQTFNFSGSYHMAWRVIPTKAMSRLTEIVVLDDRGEPLVYTRKQLDKDNPESWGKYTYFHENGAANIVWYFDRADQVSRWTLRYKVHGALTFGSDYDRLYWNIFTDYEVPVQSAVVKIALPETYPQEQIKYFQYRDGLNNSDIARYVEEEVSFIASDFLPKDKYTIDVSWPKGAVDRSEFWKQFFLGLWGYFSAGLVFIVGGCVVVYLIVREKMKKGRGTIIPEYSPPKDLKPLMAEIVTSGTASDRGIAATIIDLAVRGYLKIEEEIQGASAIFSRQKNYKVVRTAQRQLKDLEDYEKELLRIFEISESGQSFSTREIRKSSNYAKSAFLAKSLAELKGKSAAETSHDTQAFDNPPNPKLITFGLIIFFAAIFSLILISLMAPFFEQALTLVAVLVWTILFILNFLKYQTRLSAQGRLLKEEWLGFKMYLKVAERYRMQNLTPEIFEKYLPYAMVFKIEKQWVKNFSAITIPPPAWYTSNAVLVSGVNTAESFSAASFASSFPASFASSISSSAGSGAAGGGSAGGGGGGGGGGAG